jgi:single-strand DNA-binding protein
MYINRAVLYGNLTKDPELRALPSGMQVASFSIATNRTWKKDGVKQESAEFHNIVAFGKQAELIGQYLRKGQPIYIEGRMQTRSWDGQDGQKKYRTEVVIENFQFGPKGVGTGGASFGGGAGKEEATLGPSKEEMPAIQYPEEDINPEDIPF